MVRRNTPTRPSEIRWGVTATLSRGFIVQTIGSADTGQVKIRRLVKEHRPLVLGGGVSAVFSISAGVAAILDPDRAPSWLQLIPGTITVFGVLAAYLTVRANARNRVDDETAPARLLVLAAADSMYSYGSNRDVYPTVVVTLLNAGTSGSFTDIRIEGVTLAGYGCQQTIRDVFADLGNDNFKHLEPGGTVASGWVVPKPVMDITEQEKNAPFQIRYTYTDGHGRRWQRLDKTEPVRLRGNGERRAERNELFEERMRGRPNNGQPDLPPDIEMKVRSAFPHTPPRQG